MPSWVRVVGLVALLALSGCATYEFRPDGTVLVKVVGQAKVVVDEEPGLGDCMALVHSGGPKAGSAFLACREAKKGKRTVEVHGGPVSEGWWGAFGTVMGIIGILVPLLL
jgi:hypothetical protein